MIKIGLTSLERFPVKLDIQGIPHGTGPKIASREPTLQTAGQQLQKKVGPFYASVVLGTNRRKAFLFLH